MFSGFFNAIVLVGFFLISGALWFAFQQDLGGGVWGNLVGAYIFGLMFMGGAFTVYPGGTKARNEWGEKVRVGNAQNLSRLQVCLYLAWFLGFGGLLAYLDTFSPLV